MSDALTIICGDALTELRKLPDESVQCCVTSPPYWGLRDYGTAAWEGGDSDCDHAVRLDPRIESSTLGGGKESTGHQREGFKHECPRCGARRIDSQIGLEKTPEAYVAKMVDVFREVRRVLRRDGTLWLNLGSSYAGGGQGGGGSMANDVAAWRPGCGRADGVVDAEARRNRNGCGIVDGFKPKDLVPIPWMVAMALQADGWWLRSDIIWSKPNPMPESVTDRPTKSHEYLFLLTKSANYFYDAEAIRERVKDNAVDGLLSNGHVEMSGKERERQKNAHEVWGSNQMSKPLHSMFQGYTEIKGANKRSVWTVATAPYPEAHFATYPPYLIKPCIMAGTSAKGCCGKCGAPWERLQEIGESDYARIKRETGRDWTDMREEAKKRGMGHDSNRAHIGGTRDASGNQFTYKAADRQTLGWQPTCPHTDAPVVPCTVCDPFAGSGTSGAVALELGRKAVLIELNPKYVALIEERCSVTPGLALA